MHCQNAHSGSDFSPNENSERLSAEHPKRTSESRTQPNNKFKKNEKRTTHLVMIASPSILSRIRSTEGETRTQKTKTTARTPDRGTKKKATFLGLLDYATRWQHSRSFSRLRSLRDSRRMGTAPPSPQGAPTRLNPCVSAAELDSHVPYNTLLQSFQLFFLQNHDKKLGLRLLSIMRRAAGGGGQILISPEITFLAHFLWNRFLEISRREGGSRSLYASLRRRLVVPGDLHKVMTIFRFAMLGTVSRLVSPRKVTKTRQRPPTDTKL